jgi:hypothetical protein
VDEEKERKRAGLPALELDRLPSSVGTKMTMLDFNA